jgi:hypothetical protein
MEKVGRNDPCPCGSGKKYKKCCLHESYSPPGREASLQNSLIRSVLAFCKRYHRDAVAEAYDCFWGDFDPEEHLAPDFQEMGETNFWEWLVYDWQADEEGGKTLLELHAENAKNLAAEEKAVLRKMGDAVLSLYEIQEVFPEKGLLLEDLLLGGEYNVKEKMATRALRKWDIFATRLLCLDDTYIMSGSGYSYLLHQKEAIIERLTEEFEDYRKDYPSHTMRDFLKRNGHLFNDLWCEPFRKPFRPVLVTTSGEPLVFCTSVFEIKDKEGVVTGLRKIESENKGNRLSTPHGSGKDWDFARSDDAEPVHGSQNRTFRLPCPR